MNEDDEMGSWWLEAQIGPREKFYEVCRGQQGRLSLLQIEARVASAGMSRHRKTARQKRDEEFET